MDKNLDEFIQVELSEALDKEDVPTRPYTIEQESENVIRAWVFTSSIKNLEKRLKVANNRAKKLSIPELKIEFLETRYLKEIDNDGKRFFDHFTHVRVEGLYPAGTNVKFIGKIEFGIDNDNQVFVTKGNEHLISNYRHGKVECAHCNKVRNRKNTYILEKEGQIMTVGHSCLNLFINSKSVSAILWREAFIQSLKECDTRPDRISSCMNQPSPVDIISTTLNIIAVVGFNPKQLSEQVRMALNPNYTEAYSSHLRKELEKDSRDFRPKAMEIINWLNEQGVDNLDPFMANALIECKKMGYVRTGLVAWIVPKYLMHMGLLEMPKRPEIVPSKPMGEVGQKIEVELTVVNFYSREVSFGYHPQVQHVHTFKDKDNNRAMWTTSSTLWETGTVVKVKGTIKAISDHEKFGQTTILIRCKALEIVSNPPKE